ncbi:MAG: transglutaminase-like domain-containing protein [Chitinophagaceae bacterium]
MNRIVLVTITALLPFLVKAQLNTTDSFENYAHKQDSLFTQLYEKRDAKNFTAQLDEWIVQYNKQPESTRKNYQYRLAITYYNLSCTYALLNDKKPALDNLEKAVKNGYTNYSHMQVDADLDVIRNSERYTAIVKPLRAIGDYMYILRKGAAYNAKDMRKVPVFTYEPATHPELVALRKDYKLDSIAGNGNDISKVLNLLHWVHELIPHDGNHENPVVKNAASMITICRKDSRGLNCRGLSTVLNECYLSMGFASRIVTCLPKDSLGTDPDCHVINMVYVPSIKKWIWADPTNDAYVMNEKGELLGIDEVREKIIKGQPLILNPTANWNHRSTTGKEEYLYQYMAKNLYKLQCPVNSTWDMETRAAGKTIEYITLLPLDYFNQQPDRSETTGKESKTTLVFFNTNNPNNFWTKP